MKFEENLKELRKQHGLSQEDLAEQLHVSRQSISKWENGSSSPELDKLMQLCELFHCKLDDLLNGDVKEKGLVNREVYDHHENLMSKMVTLGVTLILFGMAVYCFLEPIFPGRDEYISDTIFMICITAAVVIFIYFGISDSQFKRKYKQIPQHIYQEAELDAFHKQFQIAIAGGVGLILVGVFSYVAVENLMNTAFANSFFMVLLMIAVGLFVYFGQMKTKYDNTENTYELTKESEQLIGKWCGCIMIVAVAVFLFWSFLFHAWRISWIVFPIGGLLCGIVSIILTKERAG